MVILMSTSVPVGFVLVVFCLVLGVLFWPVVKRYYIISCVNCAIKYLY